MLPLLSSIHDLLTYLSYFLHADLGSDQSFCTFLDCPLWKGCTDQAKVLVAKSDNIVSENAFKYFLAAQTAHWHHTAYSPLFSLRKKCKMYFFNPSTFVWPSRFSHRRRFESSFDWSDMKINHCHVLLALASELGVSRDSTLPLSLFLHPEVSSCHWHDCCHRKASRPPVSRRVGLLPVSSSLTKPALPRTKKGHVSIYQKVHVQAYTCGVYATFHGNSSCWRLLLPLTRVSTSLHQSCFSLGEFTSQVSVVFSGPLPHSWWVHSPFWGPHFMQSLHTTPHSQRRHSIFSFGLSHLESFALALPGRNAPVTSQTFRNTCQE